MGQAVDTTVTMTLSADDSTCTVLVARDDELIRSQLSALLTSAGYSVELAATGAEALEGLRKRSLEGLKAGSVVTTRGAVAPLLSCRSRRVARGVGVDGSLRRYRRAYAQACAGVPHLP